MILEYVQKTKDWPKPKTGKEVAAFLGFKGYFRTFIPQYSALTNQLNGIKKAEKFIWNEEPQTGARRTSWECYRKCRTNRRDS